MIEINTESVAELLQMAIDAGLHEFYIPVRIEIDNDNEELRCEISDPIQKIEHACGIDCPNLKPAAITINGMPIKAEDLALRLQG